MAAPISNRLACVRTIWNWRCISRQCSTKTQDLPNSSHHNQAESPPTPSPLPPLIPLPPLGPLPPPLLDEDPLPLVSEFTQTFASSTTSRSDTGLGTSRLLLEAVTPLWRLHYDKQLALKELRIRNALAKVTNDLIGLETPLGLTETLDRAIDCRGLCCILDKIKPSPVTEGYRNKSVFSVGFGPDGREKTVGHFVGDWKKGNVTCFPADPCPNTSQAHKNVGKAYQKFLLQSPLDASLSFEDSGNWRSITVRSNQDGDLMAIVNFVQKDLSDTQQENAVLALQDFFSYGDGKDCGLTSLYFQASDQTRAPHELAPYHLLLGRKHLHETLFDLQFRISPDAFFQVNTAAAEVLYAAVAALCRPGPDTTVLDLCCGAGAIGLVVADQVREVVGVEVSQQAVEDARVNAEINAIFNAMFVCGRVEELLPDILPTLEGSGDLVVVANPARAGLHQRVVRMLRNSESIRRLVYVSCKPEGTAAKNFVDLCRPPTTRLHGKPFTIVSAVPIDLFPHTYHCELVLLLER